VAYLARRHSEVAFVGSDFGFVASAFRERGKELLNLSISAVHLDCLTSKEQTSLQSDLVYASGGLQYLDEHSLRRFLSIVRNSTTMFILVEPLAYEFLMEESTHSTPRSNFSWNHPYSHYFLETRWANVEYEVVDSAVSSSTKGVNLWAQSIKALRNLSCWVEQRPK